MTTEATARRRERGIADGPEHGYHQTGYAVALSEDGAARVMSAYCSHLGADLSVGCVIKNEIRCAFHHWHYGERGRCTRIPVSDSIPARASLFSFPTVERWGLIWAFNGAEPLFDPPSFRAYGPDDLVWKVVPYPTIYPVEPWVLISNSHDIQHLKVLHKLTFPRGGPEKIKVGPYGLEHDIAFDTPDGMSFEQETNVFGTNTIVFTRKSVFGPSLSMWTGTSIPGGRTRGYLLSAAPKPPAGDAEAAGMVEQALGMTHGFMAALIQEDDPIMMTIRFREGVLISGDQELALFLKYIRAFPRADPLAEFM
jgi:nitrite reductase/ring-hydroxylating ferredoxin subunit